MFLSEYIIVSFVLHAPCFHVACLHATCSRQFRKIKTSIALLIYVENHKVRSLARANTKWVQSFISHPLWQVSLENTALFLKTTGVHFWTFWVFGAILFFKKRNRFLFRLQKNSIQNACARVPWSTYEIYVLQWRFKEFFSKKSTGVHYCPKNILSNFTLAIWDKLTVRDFLFDGYVMHV